MILLGSNYNVCVLHIVVELSSVHLQREIAQSVTELIEKGVSDSEFNTNLELPGLPHLGSRVARGKDWKWDNQDTEGPGTIVSHIAARKG